MMNRRILLTSSRSPRSLRRLSTLLQQSTPARPISSSSSSSSSASDVPSSRRPRWVSDAEKTILTEHDTVSLSRVRALVSTVKVSEKAASECQIGDPLPEGWSAILFRPVEATTESLGFDGTENGPHHAPSPLERMWVAGSFSFDQREGSALKIGEQVTAVSRIDKIEEKVGKDGRKGWYVHQRREMGRTGEEGTPPVVEERVHLYRYPKVEVEGEQLQQPPKQKVAGVVRGERATPSFEIDFQASPNLLFRYSAITFNTHRIHWDESYAVGIERRPGLIVHGPLTSLLLLNAFRVSLPSTLIDRGAKIDSFRDRKSVV